MDASYIHCRRDELFPHYGAEVNGRWHAAGEVRSLRSFPRLRNELPEGFSISWVRLNDGETLEPHRHPVSTFVAAAEGRAALLGQQPQNVLEPGDVAHIPPWRTHGFQASASGPFRGVSWHEGNQALFEPPGDAGTTSDPLVYPAGETPSGGVAAEITRGRARGHFQGYSYSWMSFGHASAPTQAGCEVRFPPRTLVLVTYGSATFAGEKPISLQAGDSVLFREAAAGRLLAASGEGPTLLIFEFARAK